MYKAFKAFEAKIGEGLALAFAMDFDLYKAKVAWLFFRVDVSHLNLEESEDVTEKMLQMSAPLPKPC